MGVIYADNYSPLSHSHVDAITNYKFTHCIFENVVNYLYFLFLPLFYPPMPTEKNPRTLQFISRMRELLIHTVQ